jgi:hypothetical protein
MIECQFDSSEAPASKSKSTFKTDADTSLMSGRTALNNQGRAEEYSTLLD